MRSLACPTENLILCDERGLSKGPVSGAQSAVFLRLVPGAISVSSLKICCLAHTWEALAKTGRW